MDIKQSIQAMQHQHLGARLVTRFERRAVVRDGRPVWGMVEAPYVIFFGGDRGEHTIQADNPERVQAHWEGYCIANRVRADRVGQRVDFEHGSAGRAMGGIRTGTVVSVGPKRVKVEFKYKNGRVTQHDVKHESVVRVRNPR